MEHLDMQRVYKATEEFLTEEYYVLETHYVLGMKKTTNRAKSAHRQTKLNTALKIKARNCSAFKRNVKQTCKIMRQQ